MRSAPRLSVVVPVNERPAALPDLYREFSQSLLGEDLDFEFVFVAQPWATDFTAALRPLMEGGEPIRVLHAAQPVSEADLLNLAIQHTRSPVLLTLPAYRRVEPTGLPALLAELRDGADLVVARRWPRRDAWVNRLQNRVFHALVGQLVSRDIRDLACGVRAMYREVLERVPLYGDFTRFLPVLAQREGFVVREVDVPQHPDDQQPRLYSPGVYIRRILDILGIFFLVRFTDKPLRFFGLLGAGVSFVGMVILGVLLVQRLGGDSLADRPMLLLAVLLMVLGVQGISLGLIGEIIVHVNAPHRRPYRLKEELDRGEL